MLQLSGGAKRQTPDENMLTACARRTQQERLAAAKAVEAYGLPAPVGLDAVTVAVAASTQMAATAPGVISWRWGPSSSPPPSLPPSPAHEEDGHGDDDEGQTPASAPAVEAATHMAEAAAPRGAGRHTEPKGKQRASGRAKGQAGERHTGRGAATLATGVKAGNTQHVEALLGRAADREVVEMVRQHQLLHVGV